MILLCNNTRDSFMNMFICGLLGCYLDATFSMRYFFTLLHSSVSVGKFELFRKF